MLLPTLFYAVLHGPTSYFTWTDEQGVVHFGDAPPPATEAVKHDLPASASSGLAPPPELQNWSPAARPRRKSRDHTAVLAEQQRQRFERDEQCHKVRQRLAKVTAERRAGYSPARGVTLARQKRSLRADERRYCD